MCIGSSHRILVIVISCSFVLHITCKYLKAQFNEKVHHHSSSLNIDISTKIIEFTRIARTIADMPTGGLVSKRRKLFTVKLAMRAIIDGIEGDFMETVRFDFKQYLDLDNPKQKLVCYRLDYFA